MNSHRRRTIQYLIGTVRSDRRYVPGLAVMTTVLTTAGLLSTLLGSPLTGVTVTTDAGPLVAAGGTWQPIVGFLQFGATRVYIPLVAVLLVTGGEIAATVFGRLGMLIAVVTGVIAGTKPLVVTGCGCGYGTAGSTMSLLDGAVGLL